MGKHYPNHRLVKIHRNYTVGEIADLLGHHKNTVRKWTKNGLPTIDCKRPNLILGRELIAFFMARRARKKQICSIGYMYCVRCHSPRFPAGGMAEYVPVTERVGNLRAICPDCNCLMHRCVGRVSIADFLAKIDITFPQALPHLREISSPTVNSDLK